MIKKFNILLDPIVQFIIGAVFFVIGLLDSVMRHASSISELSVVGKGCVIIIIAILAFQVVRFLIIPLLKWIASLID